MARQTLERHAGACCAGSRPYLGSGLLGSPENRYNLPHFRVHPGNPGLNVCMPRKFQHLGDRLHSLLMQAYGIKQRDWAHEAVDRAMVALNAVRNPRPPMVGEVLWMGSPSVFTLPGRYCYISRRFIERCASDAPVAFALAHEIGHHDLGHLRRAERWAASAVTHVPLKLAVLALIQLPKWVYSRHMELAADAYALELCRKSGFDLQKCLECFDILSEYMLDHRDVDGVYGADEELELDPKLTANPIHRLYIQARVWMAQHRRTHPSINERRQALLSQTANNSDNFGQQAPGIMASRN
jgi:predicted Zn-dependent protease